jgi:hypothetical protein
LVNTLHKVVLSEIDSDGLLRFEFEESLMKI